MGRPQNRPILLIKREIRPMKHFRIQIRYCGYYADFTIQCKDSAIDIEKSILDKLGKNEVKFESDGFTSKKGKWITYEAVSYTHLTLPTILRV